MEAVSQAYAGEIAVIDSLSSRVHQHAAVRAAAFYDPTTVLRELDNAIIGEIQHAPELILAIKEVVNLNRQQGRFTVTGRRIF